MFQKFDLRNRAGSALVLIAVSLTALLAATSLAIDMGQFLTARAEAQRLVDAAALAGASAFLDIDLIDDEAAATAMAIQLAQESAQQNGIRGTGIDVTTDLHVEVLFDEEKVRVWVRRLGIQTWFARFAGIFNGGIGAVAAAQAALEDTGVSCVKPWAIPDLWYEIAGNPGGGNPPYPNTDDNGDGYWDLEEGGWDLNPNDPPGAAGEYYEQWSGDPATETGTATGYGSTWRGPDRDKGYMITLKPQRPSNNTISAPFFFAWDIDDSTGDPSPAEGANQYRDDIQGCTDFAVYPNTDYYIEPGNMVGPTHQGTNALLALDPDASWNPITKTVDSPLYDPGEGSPRVITVALFDPNLIPGLIGAGGPGDPLIQFNNFAKIFLEDPPAGNTYNGQEPIRGRFLGFAIGNGENSSSTGGTLIKQLKLVE